VATSVERCHQTLGVTAAASRIRRRLAPLRSLPPTPAPPPIPVPRRPAAHTRTPSTYGRSRFKSEGWLYQEARDRKSPTTEARSRQTRMFPGRGCGTRRTGALWCQCIEVRTTLRVPTTLVLRLAVPYASDRSDLVRRPCQRKRKCSAESGSANEHLDKAGRICRNLVFFATVCDSGAC
jgi:hypothetical protein